MVECGRLEICCTVYPYRGFESLLLRQQKYPRFRGYFVVGEGGMRTRAEGSVTKRKRSGRRQAVPRKRDER